MSREGANLASRSTEDHQTIMDALASTADPLDMPAYGMIYITQLEAGLTGNRSSYTVQMGQWSAFQPPSKVLASHYFLQHWNNNECNPTGTQPTANLSVLHLDAGALAEGRNGIHIEVFCRYRVIFKQNNQLQSYYLLNNRILAISHKYGDIDYKIPQSLRLRRTKGKE